MKRCSSCHVEKNLNDFGVNKRIKDGRMNRCIECNRKQALEIYEIKHGTKKERQSLQEQLLTYIINLRADGHKLREISEITGLDKSSISYYLSGKRKVGMNAVRKYKECTSVVHECPPESSGLTPCCGKTPFELPKKDRLTLDPKLVTCAAGHA